jgi:hypothetical protein
MIKMTDKTTQWQKDLALAKKAEPIQDKIYYKLFPNLKEVKRLTGTAADIIDHVDVELIMNNGTVMRGQEKALRHKWSHMGTFTIEYYQDRVYKTPGEYFSMKNVQFYLHSYWDEQEQDFCKWYFIKMFDMLDYLADCPNVFFGTNLFRPESSNAAALKIDYDAIPDDYIYACDDKDTGRKIIRQRRNLNEDIIAREWPEFN